MKSDLLPFITTNIPVYGIKSTTSEILEDIKSHQYEDVHIIFVVDNDNKLEGQISMDALLKSELSSKAGDLLVSCSPVQISSTPAFAANHAVFSDISSIPVIDQTGKFVGKLKTNAIIEILRKEHISDLHKIAGIQKEGSVNRKTANEAPARRVKHRLPWLLIGLVGTFFATYLMSGFETLLHDNISLSFFIPGIVYLADAIGTQTETIVIRGMTLSSTSFRKILLQEIQTGFLIGLILGIISLPIIFFGGYDFKIALIVSSTVVLAGLVATSIGLILPWLLHLAGKDPAFGSGPLATIIQDILIISIYLLIAGIVISEFQ